ncbi:glycosyltransferase family 2 protein [Dyadobacter aurulentus]|uniref:glycosyltransferase family 2 protein n=1 Tax=Dyadobacter sp. UC 10 TaxID=2605428 RepID=UPI0011F30031|nr:glycosyltransferase family A protein [Dyadobacter sp. UC 10]KAA0988870.1 glycosyltransferase family 2 protein [Dyadobacter sp. UC 10]
MISIVIPCYNCEHFLSRAIDSVLSQTYTYWELLLVNNNSKDSTQVIIDHYVQAYPEKIRALFEIKPGAPAARNRGLKEARGKWVQYLDADDELLPEKLDGQIAIAEAKRVDCVIGNCSVVGERNGKPYKTLRPINREDVWIALINSHLGITSANIWRTSLLQQLGGWNEELTSSQEYDLLFRLLKAGGKLSFDDSNRTIIYKADSGISLSKNSSKLVSIIDNRVKLRLQIREFLTSINELTKKRNKMILTYISRELLNNKLAVKDIPSLQKVEFLSSIPIDIFLQFHIEKTVKRALAKIRV